MHAQYDYQNGGLSSPSVGAAATDAKSNADFDTRPSVSNNGSLEFDELLASGGKKRKRFDANNDDEAAAASNVLKYKGGAEQPTTAAGVGHPGAFDYAKGYEAARTARATGEEAQMADEYARGGVPVDGGELTAMARTTTITTSNEEMGGVGGGPANNNYASSEDLNQTNNSELGEKAGMSGSDDENTGECIYENA